MTTRSAGERAVSTLEIEDVLIVSADLKLDREFNQTGQGEFGSVHRIGVDSSVFFQKRVPLANPDAPIFIIRYFVKGDVEIAKPGVAVSGDSFPEADRLALLSFVFAVDYRCLEGAQPDHDAVSAFAQNAVFHAWPYWRESVHAATARMRLPTVTVPMFRRPSKVLANDQQPESSQTAEAR